jgi:hypothetical protein
MALPGCLAGLKKRVLERQSLADCRALLFIGQPGFSMLHPPGQECHLGEITKSMFEKQGLAARQALLFYRAATFF